ncbi:putative PurR-regulated permease PerM [Shimia isoporae]|uniref:Putative PurR-regulated permease PerM n=1 Tax=Shimia isoporae TaxID=647720 RepID=A0A4R1NP20_9RHOB|nr:AI-2E family transporter [Shimia isoporae]TCL09579.1 putative PurR-regulated permease PerM [Shimia isoporae]
MAGGVTVLRPLMYFVVSGFFLVAGLVFAAEVLVPLSIAILLFVLVTAIVDRVRDLRIGGRHVPAAIAHLAALCAVLFGLWVIVTIFASQAGSVTEAVPRYEARFDSILTRIVALVGDQNFEAAKAALSEMEIAGFATGAISSAGGFLSGLLLVLLYIPFMLVERGPMRRKLEIAFPEPEVLARVQKMGEGVSLGLQRYVGIKTFVSILTGLGSYCFMKPVGLDFAETWAVLIFMLNFIPTLGSMIGVAIPSVVALVQFETFTPFLIILAGCGVVQFGIGNVVEPAITGRSLNLSPLMVILSLTFWTAIWGIAGAFLSVPITVCMLIVLSHVKATRTLAVLMSGDGRLMVDDPPDPATKNAKEAQN